MSRRSLNGAGTAGWLMADLFLILTVMAGISQGTHPDAGVASPSPSPTASPSPEPSSTATPSPTIPPGISQESFTELGGDSGFDFGPDQHQALLDAILKPYKEGTYGRPGIVLVFGVAQGSSSGTEVSQQAIDSLRGKEGLEQAVFRNYLRLHGDPGELHAEVFYYPAEVQ